MRQLLRIFRCIGLMLSTLLLAGTVFCWVRSLGHEEGWEFARLEPQPDWRAPDLVGQGIRREWYVRAIHGRLWLGSRTRAPVPEFKPETQYLRGLVSADESNEHFDSYFKPGERRWCGGTERAWPFAGAGFYHGHLPVDPQIGQPSVEAIHLTLPFWMLAVVFGLWPTLFVARRLLRKKRRAPGLCPACGYDLRATPDPAGPLLPRCPECGRAVAAAGA